MQNKKSITLLTGLLLIIVPWLVLLFLPIQQSGRVFLLFPMIAGTALYLLHRFVQNANMPVNQKEKILTKIETFIKLVPILLLKVLAILVIVAILGYLFIVLMNLLLPDNGWLRNRLTWQTIYFVGFFLVMITLIFGGMTLLKRRIPQARMMKVMEWLSGPMIAALTMVCFIFVLELLARYYVANNEYAYNGRYLNAIPYGELLHDDVMYSDYQYVNEIDVSLKIDIDPEIGIYLPDDMRGSYINIIDRVRVTTNQPAQYNQTIYMFGGSTMECVEGADWMTLPSYFQRKVNIVFPDTYRVVNMGVIGLISANQTVLLKTIDLQPGDIVIFFDGNNDVNSAFQFDFFVFPDINNGPVFVKLADQLIKHSIFFDIFLAPYNYLPSITHDVELQQVYVNQMLDYYNRSLIEAKDYAERKGAEFYHFLQPTLFTVSELSANEQKILRDYQFIPNGWADLHYKGYLALIDYNDILIDEGIISFDITDAFDPEFRQPNQEFFFDQVHVNYEGNELLAKRIFEIIQPYLFEGRYE